MESQYVLNTNGQEVQQSDLNLLGTSAIIDDRVLYQLFQFGFSLFDGKVHRGIIQTPADFAGGGLGIENGGRTTVAVNTPLAFATTGFSPAPAAAIFVSPHRAVIGGPPGLVGGDITRDTWQHALQSGRSTIVIDNSGTFNGYTKVSFAANSSGNARWDLVYTFFQPDVSASPVVRYVKDPTTLVVSPVNVSVSKSSTASIGVLQGVPSATPALPAPPGDSAGVYIIPLCYVRIPNGFNGASIISNHDILLCSFNAILSASGTGVVTSRPAESMYRPDSTDSTNGLTATVIGGWANSGNRPEWVMQNDMVGCETIFIALDLSDPSSANWSHRNGAIIDRTRDWRQRLFYSIGFCVPTSSGPAFAYRQATGSNIPWVISGRPTDIQEIGGTSPAGLAYTWGQSFGQSFKDQHTGSSSTGGFAPIADMPSANTSVACAFYNVGNNFNNSNMAALATNTLVGLYVDHVGDGVVPGGALKLFVSGVPSAKILIKLDCYGPMASGL